MADSPAGTFPLRRWLFRAAWVLLAIALIWPRPSQTSGSGTVTALVLYDLALGWSNAIPGAPLDPGFWNDALLALALFAHILFLYPLYLHDDRGLAIGWKILGAMALPVAAAVAIVTGARLAGLHELPSRWAWLASMGMLGAGYLVPPAGGTTGLKGAPRGRRAAAAVDRGDVPPVVWVLLAFTAFWIAVSASNHARPRNTAADAFTSPLTDYVNDRANVLGAGERTALSLKLQTFAASSGSQLVVAIYPHAPEGAIEAFTIGTVEQLPIGRSGRDNGVLLFVFMAQRAARLEIGYGLEGVLTDVDAHRILDQKLAPAFAMGAYEAGIDATLQAVMAAAQAADQGNRLPGAIGLAARKLTSGPPLRARLARAIRDASLLTRIGLTLFCTFIGFAVASSAAQWGKAARDARRGAANLMAGRQAAEGMERVDVATLWDSLRIVAWALAILLPTAGAILIAAGGAFGGAGALVHW